MAKRTPDFPAYPEWSTAKFFSFLRSALRGAHIRWPPAQNVMKQGRRTVTGKRHKYEHQCSICNKWKQQKDIEKDHIIPVGSLNCFDDLPGFVKRLFVDESGYRKVCTLCHKALTKEQRDAK